MCHVVVEPRRHSSLRRDVRAALNASERRAVVDGLREVRSVAFKLPETDFKLRRAQRYPIWKD